MILYSLPISNYCGKVLHALRFKDVECEIIPHFWKTVCSAESLRSGLE